MNNVIGPPHVNDLGGVYPNTIHNRVIDTILAWHQRGEPLVPWQIAASAENSFSALMDMIDDEVIAHWGRDAYPNGTLHLSLKGGKPPEWYCQKCVFYVCPRRCVARATGDYRIFHRLGAETIRMIQGCEWAHANCGKEWGCTSTVCKPAAEHAARCHA